MPARQRRGEKGRSILVNTQGRSGDGERTPRPWPLTRARFELCVPFLRDRLPFAEASYGNAFFYPPARRSFDCASVVACSRCASSMREHRLLVAVFDMLSDLQDIRFDYPHTHMPRLLASDQPVSFIAGRRLPPCGQRRRKTRRAAQLPADV